jgi:hypothetical protein
MDNCEGYEGLSKTEQYQVIKIIYQNFGYVYYGFLAL